MINLIALAVMVGIPILLILVGIKLLISGTFIGHLLAITCFTLVLLIIRDVIGYSRKNQDTIS